MTGDIVAGVVCWLLSLSLEIVPGFRALWAKVPTDAKPGVMLLLCLVVTCGLPLLACVGVDFRVGATCPAPGTTVNFIVSSLFVGYAAFGVASATFGYVQAPLSARLKAKG